MTMLRNLAVANVAALAILALPGASAAATVTANCTGMLDFDIYSFDTEKPVQDVNKIGTANFQMDDKAIVLTGKFGEYRFDLKVGTLYHNGSDTGIYCTYSGPPA